MTVGGSAGNPALLNFNLGNGSVDTIAVSGSLTVNAGGAIIGLNQLSGTWLARRTYNLLTFSSGSGLGGLTFAGGATTINQNGDAFKLVSTTGCRSSCRSSPRLCYAYWTGTQGTSSGARWPAAATPTGQQYQRAGHRRPSRPAITNVFFTASGGLELTPTRPSTATSPSTA